MAEESCVTDGQDSFFMRRGRNLPCLTANLQTDTRLASAAKQIIPQQHAYAYNQKTDKITWNDPHEEHPKPNTEQGITDDLFHYSKPRKKMHIL